MTPSVAVFAPEAAEQLAAIYRYIAANASPGIAERYTSAIISLSGRLTLLQIKVPFLVIARY